MGARSRAGFCVGLVATALSARGAWAQAPDSTAIAEGLFQQGRELVKAGHLDEACPKLAESQRLDPKLGTLLNLAVCHEQQGRTATAWAEYTSAAAIAKRDGQREREEFARKQAATLEKRLGRVILQVSAPDQTITIKLDGQTMTAAVYGVPLPVDPGTHQVTASGAGKAPWSKSVLVPTQGGEILIQVPALMPGDASPVPPAPLDVPPPAPVIAPTPAVVAPVSPPPIQPPPPPSEPPSSTPKVLMGVGFGVGGLGLLVGAIAGGVSLANTSTIRGGCTANVCRGQSGAISSATALANVSNAMIVIGLVGVGVGIAGVALRPKDPATTAVTLTPVVTANGGGLRLAF